MKITEAQLHKGIRKLIREQMVMSGNTALAWNGSSRKWRQR